MTQRWQDDVDFVAFLKENQYDPECISVGVTIYMWESFRHALSIAAAGLRHSASVHRISGHTEIAAALDASADAIAGRS